MILDWFRRRGGRWHPLERELILALADRMPAAAGELARPQVDAVTLVQRAPKGLEVSLYRQEGGAVVWPDDLRFPNRHQTLRVARMPFVMDGEQATRRVTFHAVEGILFSLTFDRSPAKIGDRRIASIGDVEWYVDLLDPSSPASAPPNDLEFPPDYPPPSGDPFFQDLPERGVVVLNAPDPNRAVTVEDGTFELLAELHDIGVLGVKEGAGPAVYLLRYGGEPAEWLSESFKTAISEALKRGPI
jgi:hypothetical protein